MKKILKQLKPVHFVAATCVLLLVALCVYLFEVNRVYYVLYKTYGRVDGLFSGRDPQAEKIRAEVEGSLSVAGELGRFTGELFFLSPRKCALRLDSERAGKFRIINDDRLWVYFEGAKTVLEGRPSLVQPESAARRSEPSIVFAVGKNEVNSPEAVLVTFGDLGSVLKKRIPRIAGVDVAITRTAHRPEGKVFTVRGTFSDLSRPPSGIREIDLDILARRWLPLGLKAAGAMRGIEYSLDVHLKNIDFDPVLPPDAFDFEPPAGTSVVSMSRDALVQMFKYYAQATKAK